MIKILIADDQELIRQSLMIILDNVPDFEVVDCVGDGIEVMASVKEESNFSGGQKQRLVIARAILHDSDIYIFDEATSNIDVESEDKIMQVVQDLAKKKLVILISHRLANVVKADQIYVVEKGLIKETGNHTSLIEKKGAYHALYTAQQELEKYAKGEKNGI